MSEYEYNATRMANLGRNTARAYNGTSLGVFLQASGELVQEITDAIANNVESFKISRDMMGRCYTDETRVNLLMALAALRDMGGIPQEVIDPLKEGTHVEPI